MFDDDEETQLKQKRKRFATVQVLRLYLAWMKSACVMLKPLASRPAARLNCVHSYSPSLDFRYGLFGTTDMYNFAPLKQSA